MSRQDTNARIQRRLEDYDIENQYGVRVTYNDQTGAWNVQAMGELGEEVGLGDIGYSVDVRALEGDLQPNPNLARTLGVDLVGEPTTDFGNMSEALFNLSPSAGDFDENYPDFDQTALHRVAVVSAFVRSGGHVLPEAFARDPSFGAAGAGPDILPFVGENGQILSKTGIAHDTDWALGAMGTKGPMWALGTLEGEIPSGLHGLQNAEFQIATGEAIGRGLGTLPLGLGKYGDNLEAWAKDQLDTLNTQRDAFPDGRLDPGDLPPYDRGFGVGDWGVGMYQMQRGFDFQVRPVEIFGEAGDDGTQVAQDGRDQDGASQDGLVAVRLDTHPAAAQELDTYLLRGGDPALAREALTASVYPEGIEAGELERGLPALIEPHSGEALARTPTAGSLPRETELAADASAGIEEPEESYGIV